jgi:hypothetical protein
MVGLDAVVEALHERHRPDLLLALNGVDGQNDASWRRVVRDARDAHQKGLSLT